MNVDELRELSAKLADEPEHINNLTDEQAIDLQKYLNPLGNVVSSDREYANVSIMNWKEAYMKKLMMTSLTGYIYRLQNEYEPTAEIKYLEDRLDAACVGKTESEVTALRADHTKYVATLTKTTRGVIKKFLDRNFEYNPDMHLRSAKSTNPTDPERDPGAIARACETAGRAPAIEAKLSAKPEAMYSYLRSNMLNSYQLTVQSAAEVKSSLNVLLDTELSPADKHGILLKKYKGIVDIATDMKKIAEPLSTADTLAAWNVETPIDAFHQYDRYVTNHYEQLREVCASVYNEKPDIEFSIAYYKSFETPEDAASHRNQHESDFRAEVLTIENAGITLLGPFKENRGRVEFYNKNTEIMKRMMTQMESDHKLGKDLMEKKVKKAKKRNIEREGPDDPGLAAYSKAMNTVQELGAKKVLTREEHEKLKAANTVREDAEIPDDAIQVDMFTPVTNEDGETTLEKNLFYSQAETPLHLQDDSEFGEKYQPARTGSLKAAYTTKKIVSKTGETKTIKTVL
jgi:hypothetical protein|tara:strand:- start:27042 stop:28586 length:1545 start_codon:yes stop_codon:yes gene_type:complete